MKKGPALEMKSSKPVMEFFGIIFVTSMMFVGLLYRWTFSINMAMIVGLQKHIFDLKAFSGLIITGAVLAFFPLLPIVEPQPRIYIV